MKIFVAGSMSDDVEQKYFESAEQLGRVLARGKNNHLVFGGFKLGPVGRVYQVMKNAGRGITSIVPRAYAGLDTQCENAIIAGTMSERIQRILDESDAVIAIPGGTGTLLELLLAIDTKKAGEHNKPIVLLNSHNYFSGLIEQFEKGYTEGFAEAKQRECFYVTDNPGDAVAYIRQSLDLNIKTARKR